VRTTVIGPHLERKHQIVYFVPEAVKAFVVSRMGPRRCERIPHFAFQKRGERVRLLASIACAIPLLLRFPFEMIRLVTRLRALRIEAVISDFDPFLPWAARIAGIPVLQTNHPGVIQRLPTPHPVAAVSALATRFLEGPWDERIHISFYGGDVGPILREEIFAHPVTNDGPFLVNLKESLRPVVLPVLQALGAPYRLVPDPRENFEEALASCSFVLSTAGHQIIAESVALNKPILVIPQRGSWEQQMNAAMVEQTGKGRATTIERLGADLAEFMQNLDRYRSNRVPARFRMSDDRASIHRRINAFLRRCQARKSRLVLLPGLPPARPRAAMPLLNAKTS
jgi:UDP:flavonoid glycosyltransferase YjiC (YdhE family)